MTRSFKKKGPLGATLIATLGITALLAAALGVLFAAVLSSGKGSGAAIQRRKTFYACDGISRGLAVVASDYFSEDDSPTTSELETYICAKVGCVGSKLTTLTPAGYETPTFNINIESSDSGLIPSGPFEGMNARIDTLTLDFETKSIASETVCRIEETLSIGKIALFQFFAFSEYALDLGSCAPTTVIGRVHVNGDFCGGCSSGTNGKIERITASGRILKAENCPRYTSGSGKIHFRDKSVPGSWVELTKDATDIAGWADYAINTYKGNVQDASHGVPELKVPFVARPSMQDGKDSQRNTHSNAESMRFFVDPVPFSEDVAVSEERLAWKADIRIIDGVWYKNDGSFPGTPIWSDHPGSAKTKLVADGYIPSNIDVGQNDILTNQGYGKIPRLYSYYEYDPVNQRLCEASGSSGLCTGDSNDHKGVISYGALRREDTSPPTWYPGFWRHDSESSGVATYPATHDGNEYGLHREPYCTRKNNSGDFYDDSDKIVSAKDTNCYYEDTGAYLKTDKGSNYLESTRQGFDDPRVHLGKNEGKDPLRGRMLPINFDIAAFTEAMKSNQEGELGTHFDQGDTFNGIVWIGSTWDEQMDLTNPKLWPYNGDSESHYNVAKISINTNSTGVDGAISQRALPKPLCSDDLGYVSGGTRTPYGDKNGQTTSGTAISAFSIPKCEDQQSSYPNAIRLINASVIDKATFPKGLTISTNLPGYMLGELNTASNDSDKWVPFLFAADAITGVSNHWKDDRSPWQSSNSNVASYASHNRPARDTQWRAAMMFGHVWPVLNDSSAAGLQNWVRFIEDWGNSSQKCIVDGSLVVGYSSVFENQTWDYNPVFKACKRVFTFDTKFNSIANQPPGAPTFTVSAVKNWKRN